MASFDCVNFFVLFLLLIKKMKIQVTGKLIFVQHVAESYWREAASLENSLVVQIIPNAGLLKKLRTGIDSLSLMQKNIYD